MSDDKKREDHLMVPEEGDVKEQKDGRSRRDFLRSIGKWSAAIIGSAVIGGLFEPTNTAAWVNGTAAWVNARGGWINRGGSWVNRSGGGATWVNRAGGGGGGWVNRAGGGGAAWVNRRGF